MSQESNTESQEIIPVDNINKDTDYLKDFLVLVSNKKKEIENLKKFLEETKLEKESQKWKGEIRKILKEKRLSSNIYSNIQLCIEHAEVHLKKRKAIPDPPSTFSKNHTTKILLKNFIYF